MDSVFIHPDNYREPWVNRSLTDIVPNLITYNLIAYNDRDPNSTTTLNQNMTLGATSNIIMEACSNVHMYVSPSHALRLFETSIYPNTTVRTDNEIFSVSRNAMSNATVIYAPDTLAIDTSNLDIKSHTVTLSHTTLSLSSNQQIVSTTEPFGFLLDNHVQINGNAFVNDHLVAVGNIYGNNLNMFRTYDDPLHDRVGFAFNINDEEQLELIKYSRYFHEDTRQYHVVTRKIVTFGGRPFLNNDPSDVQYSAFDLLDGASVPTNSIHSNVTFSGIGTGSIRPVVDTAARGFNMQLDGATKFSGDIVPTRPSIYDIGQSNMRLRTLYTTSLDISHDAYYKGNPLVSSQWATASSNIYYGTDLPDGVGNVGIGTDTPLYRLVVNGEIASSGDHIAYSDARLKTDIQKIESALDRVKQLSGYTFTKTQEAQHQKRSTGVLAQEVQSVLPEAVHEDAQGYLSVAYGNMVGLLIEAIKEMSNKIDKLQQPKQRKAPRKQKL